MKPARFVLGLTGGIGSGKSAALAEFARLGASVVDADEIARAQARRGGPGWRGVVRAFGRGVLDARGELDRAALAARVFSDAAARRRLERAAHPPILRELSRRIARARGLVVADVPLLFEGGLERRFDATALVTCPLPERLRRVRRRDGISAADAARRARAQWPERRKRALADLRLDNGGSRAALRAKVRRLYAGLTLLHGGTPNGNADQNA